MVSKTAYLSGPIKGLSYGQATDWRQHAIEVLRQTGIVGISPMRYKEYLNRIKILDEENYIHLEEMVAKQLTSDIGITARDKFDTLNCGVFLANLLKAEKVSIGTMIEYGWAAAANKPIITIIEKEGNPHDHQIIRALSSFRIETLDDGLHIAKAILADYP
jgi:nucleoside 2-deoxyribosyltransferase